MKTVRPIKVLKPNVLKTKALRMSVMALSLSLFSQISSALPVYINEFHYDNAGGDVNEFVELAGIAGTDLSGWSLEFYNGGNGRRYMTWLLGGSINDQENGMGALAFTGRGGIQNGGSDGIALVDSVGVVQQFLSYEGVLTAANGTATGLTSLDIGIHETSNSVVGQSLQLVGSGREELDFTWQVGDASAGRLNMNQFIAPVIHTPVINTIVRAPSVSNVPEPSSLALSSLIGMLLWRKRGKFTLS